MAGTMEGLSTINSFLRTLVAIVVVGVVGVGGWMGYSKFNAGEIEAKKKAAELKDANEKLAKANEDLEVKDAEIVKHVARIAEQQTQIEDLNVEVKKLETSLAFLKVDHRVAKFTALDQTKDEATGDITTLIEFVEVNDEGARSTRRVNSGCRETRSISIPGSCGSRTNSSSRTIWSAGRR